MDTGPWSHRASVPAGRAPGEDPAGGAVYGLLPGALVLIPAPGQREGEPVVSATQSVALSRPEHPTGVHTASRAGDRLHAKCSAHHLSRYLFVPGVLQGTEGQRRFIDFVTAARGRLPRTEGPSCSRGRLVSEPASPGRDCSVAQTQGGGMAERGVVTERAAERCPFLLVSLTFLCHPRLICIRVIISK